MQQGLEHWLSELKDKPLPVLSLTKTHLQGQLRKSQLSITRYAHDVALDVGLNVQILRYVNRQRLATSRPLLTTLDSALSYLGQGGFEQRLQTLTTIEQLELSKKNAQGLMRALSMSAHGAVQASLWAEQRQTHQSDEVQLSALLHYLAECMLWCYADEVMPRIEHACYVDKTSYEAAAEKVIGCSLVSLSRSLAEAWGLPEMVVDSLGRRLGDVTADDFTLAYGVGLASELARLSTINWYSADMQKLSARIARYKGRAEGEVERMLHLYALQAGERLKHYHYSLAARLLPMLAADDYIDPQYVFQDKPAEGLSTQPTSEAQSAEPEAAGDVQSKPAVAPRAAKKAATPALSVELAQAIKEFKSMVAQGRPAHDLIEFMTAAIMHCGVQRCMFAVKVTKKSALVAKYTQQGEAQKSLQGVVINLKAGQLFSLLLEKGKGIFIHHENREKFSKLIPDPLKLRLGTETFFAIPVFANKHALGVVYADSPHSELSKAQYSQFQALCQMLSKGIVQSALNKKKAEA